MFATLFEEDQEEMKMSEPGKQNFKKCNSWQYAKHTRLYSDLPKAEKREPKLAVDFKPRDVNLLPLWYAIAGMKESVNPHLYVCSKQPAIKYLWSILLQLAAHS